MFQDKIKREKPPHENGNSSFPPVKGVRQIGAILHAKAMSATAGRVCD